MTWMKNWHFLNRTALIKKFIEYTLTKNLENSIIILLSLSMKGPRQCAPWICFSHAEIRYFQFGNLRGGSQPPETCTLWVLCSAAAASAFFMRGSRTRTIERAFMWMENKVWLIKNNISYQNHDEVRVKEWGDVCIIMWIYARSLLGSMWGPWYISMNMFFIPLHAAAASSERIPPCARMRWRKSTQRRI